jgi:hypothetical protein
MRYGQGSFNNTIFCCDKNSIKNSIFCDDHQSQMRKRSTFGRGDLRHRIKRLRQESPSDDEESSSGEYESSSESGEYESSSESDEESEEQNTSLISKELDQIKWTMNLLAETQNHILMKLYESENKVAQVKAQVNAKTLLDRLAIKIGELECIKEIDENSS